MLVLSRRTGEQILLGRGESAVVVTLIDIDKGRVRLGIVADKAVPVTRRELLDAEDLAALPEPLRKALGLH